jgi:hypothetical protein
MSAHDPDEAATNQLDPLVPREIDLPRVLSPGGVIDPERGDIAKIFAAPDDPAAWPAWRADLVAWREDARRRHSYRGAAYDDPATAWTQRCYAVGLIWLWDERLFDHDAQGFTPQRLIEWYADHGGLDAVVLWHAYPVIGIDDRNQFDFYREVPGIAGLVADLRAAGLRVFLDYNPWDTGTRRAPRGDGEEFAALAAELGTDGVFLDTLKHADPAIIDPLRGSRPPQVLEGESRVPIPRIEDHQLSWAQWFADSPVPGVFAAHWYERRHMLHSTRRWNRDHSDELQSSWLNGTGMLLWDAVFGSWVGWNPRDRDTLRRMLAVQRELHEVFLEGEWEPLTELAPEAHAAGLFASRFRRDDATLWAIVNRSDSSYRGPVVPAAEPVTEVPARGIAVVVEAAPGARAAAVADRVRGLPQSDDAGFPARDATRVPAPVSSGTAPADAIPIPPGTHRLTIEYRRRETGMYDGAPYVEEWKPLPPRLHDDRTESIRVDLRPAAVASREVTAGEYGEFCARTGRPLPPAIASGADTAPATGVTLREARAYATWAGARLPDEFEWQVAASGPGFGRRDPAVWNWTESEHSDGITRFVMLKGGSEHVSTGSDWYFDGGPRGPEFTAKYLLAGLGVEASTSIGFRLAWDVPE